MKYKSVLSLMWSCHPSLAFLSSPKVPYSSPQKYSSRDPLNRIAVWETTPVSSTLIKKSSTISGLQLSSSNKSAEQTKKQTETKNSTKGVYVRPSAAIERGSGFYVPGLEGSRVRLLFGAAVLILNYINFHLLASNEVRDGSSFQVSETLANVYGLLLILQGSVETAKEMGLGMSDASRNFSNPNVAPSIDQTTENISSSGIGSSRGLTQVISSMLQNDNEIIEAMRWVATSFIAITSATHVLILEGNESASGEKDASILYSVSSSNGNLSSEEQSTEQVRVGVQSAIDTVYQSKGGRVSIPSTHPSSVSLLPPENRRCVLLQKITTPNTSQRRVCLLIGSDQLLQSYTKNDLKWLGALAKYLSCRC